MASRARVVIYVQHLLGSGHLRRAAALARAMQAENLAVTVISGGVPVPGVNFGSSEICQLPALKALDERISELVDADGHRITDAWRQQRSAQLLDIVNRAQPQALIIESFPFGRRKLRFELIPLLELVDSWCRKPKVICSIRDILQRQSKSERVVETVALVRRYIDMVLVHGDREFITLEKSYPAASEIADKIYYTGFVEEGEDSQSVNGAETIAENRDASRAGVLVSAGGGAVGAQLFATALDARPLTRLHDEPWRCLVGYGMAEPEFQALADRAEPGITVERARSDFRRLLRRAVVSISQAGYNTVLDLMDTGTPAVLVPFVGEGETEQTQRAERMQELARAQVVAPELLDAATLTAAVDRAVTMERSPRMQHNSDGAAHSARIIAASLTGSD